LLVKPFHVCKDEIAFLQVKLVPNIRVDCNSPAGDNLRRKAWHTYSNVAVCKKVWL